MTDAKVAGAAQGGDPQGSGGQGRAGQGSDGQDSAFDAFISYSHSRDRPTAALLTRELQRFTKPWYRPRSFRMFQDSGSLAAAPQLWGAIEARLARSNWLVLLASPDSAGSSWVEREVMWWLGHRSTERLVVVLTDGEIVWDERAGDFDWSSTTAVGRYLSGVFDGEPLWVDMRWLREAGEEARSDVRLQDAVGTIAAAVSGVDKDELVGEHLRQHRRTLRLARSAVLTLSLLLVVALVAALTAYNQRNEARRQARIAVAGQLAATSDALLPQQLDQAMLIAAQGYALMPSAARARRCSAR